MGMAEEIQSEVSNLMELSSGVEAWETLLMKRRTLLMCLSMQLASSRTWKTVYVLVLFILPCFELVGSFDSQLDFALLSLETSLVKFFWESLLSENIAFPLFEDGPSPFEIPLGSMC